MANKVAINGLGRIGRAALKLALEEPQLELVAVNEIGSLDNMVYLLRYDTVYGRYERQVDAVDGKLVIDGKPLAYLSERDPEQLPWAELEVDLVLECTGLFTDREDAEKHVRAGASWVVLSGPTRARTCRPSSTGSTGPTARPRSSPAPAAPPTTSPRWWRSSTDTSASPRPC
jgi:glyceraldehyde 3-phosphate dehydrogenase